MALYTVSGGGTVQAADINQFTNYLLPVAGVTILTGHYYFTFFATASGQFNGGWIALAQRGPTAVSATADASTNNPAQITGINTGHIDQSGVLIYTSTNAASVNIGYGGAWSLTY